MNEVGSDPISDVAAPDVAAASPGFTVVARLLWPGVGRMAIEEARRLPADLLVYRESSKPVHYDLGGVRLRYLRYRNQRGRFTPLFTAVSMLYNPGRGEDATVDLDLVARASSVVDGPALFHDQFAGLTGCLRRVRSGQPFALYLHETALGESPGVMTVASHILNCPIRWFDSTVLHQARIVLTNSRLNQSVLREHGIRSEVVYPGCDPEPELPRQREPIVLATSVWEPTRKMEFYAELARLTRARVVLAGTWARDEEMQVFRKKYGHLVEVTGPISEIRLRELSRRASLYVFFGFGERGPGQGGIQALAFGLPVIANRGLAMTELIDQGVDGFVVDDGVAGASERVNHLLDDPGTLRRMSLAAWTKSKQLSWASHAERLRKLLRAGFPELPWEDAQPKR